MRTVPALEIHFPAAPAAADLADRVLALLDETDPSGIHEGTVAPDAVDAPPRTWQVVFATAEARDRAATLLSTALASSGLVVDTLELADEDWVDRSQQHWPLVRVGRLIVAPPWNVPDEPGATTIVIQPGRGFGTGHHASTRLCLEALQQADPAARRVIDAGTGSGLLAIAAAKLGARWVVAFDADLDAVLSAADNLARNAVGDRVTLLAMDLARARRAGLEPADLVLANLTAALLAREASTLWSLVAPGATLVAGGLLPEQVPEVEAAFQRAGRSTFSRAARLDADGWAALVARRER